MVRRQQARFSPTAIATIALLLALGWQFLTVTRNYHGDWTALFCIGNNRPPAPALTGMYRFQDSYGFDGQQYLLIATDPFFRHQTPAFVDDPGLRYRRILIPLLAYVFSGGGSPHAVAYAYIAVNLGFLFLGTWWLGRIVQEWGESPVWGLAFLLIPGVLISLDRETVDMAFTALVLGASFAWQTGRYRLLFVVLAALCLVRETGLLIAGGFLIVCLVQRWWRQAILCTAAMLPFWIWSSLLGRTYAPAFQEWLPTQPYAWTLKHLFHPVPIPYSPAIQTLVACIDLLAISGLLLAVLLSLRAAMKARLESGPLLGAALMACLCVYLLSLEEWMHAYDYGRLASPMVAALLAERATAGRFRLLPAALMTARVLVQLVPQGLGVLGIHL